MPKRFLGIRLFLSPLDHNDHHAFLLFLGEYMNEDSLFLKYDGLKSVKKALYPTTAKFGAVVQ